MEHEVKLNPKAFQSVLNGVDAIFLNREIKENDRLRLREWNFKKCDWTGAEAWAIVTAVEDLKGFKDVSFAVHNVVL